MCELQKTNKTLLEQEALLRENYKQLEVNNVLLLERMGRKTLEQDTAETVDTASTSRRNFRQGRAKVASMTDIGEEVSRKLAAHNSDAREVVLPRRYTLASLSTVRAKT